MKTMYKAVIKAEDYNSQFDDNLVRAVPLQTGDSIFIASESPVNVGDQYEDYDAIIAEVYYESKKWWEFWKKKKQLGYRVEWDKKI